MVLLLVALMVAPWPSPRAVTPNAQAGIIQVPTPGLTDILGTPKPDNDDDEGGNDGGGDEGGNDGGGDDGGNDDELIGNEDEGGDDGTEGKGNDKSGKDGGKDGKGKDGKGKGGKDISDLRKGGKKKKDKKIDPPDSVAGRIPGAYDTRKLVAVAAQLRGLGESHAEVTRRVFPPFIIAGPASWVDTWHAPRYGPAPGQIRQHEGQDVFCDYGDPILAPENGTLSLSDGGLGGITVRVHMADGSYWYMTHLSDLNTEQFAAGDSVTIGDVVGYCGNSGNAATTPPHVHFGWYQPSGKAKNPMRPLIDWLHEAERRVLGAVSKKTAERAKKSEIFTAAHRFGDAFVADRSEFRVAGESLWASGSDPGIGTYELAEAALRAALATQGLDYEPVGQPVDLEAHEEDEATGSLDPDSALAELLETRHVSIDEAGD